MAVIMNLSAQQQHQQQEQQHQQQHHQQHQPPQHVDSFETPHKDHFFRSSHHDSNDNVNTNHNRSSSSRRRAYTTPNVIASMKFSSSSKSTLSRGGSESVCFFSSGAVTCWKHTMTVVFMIIFTGALVDVGWVLHRLERGAYTTSDLDMASRSTWSSSSSSSSSLQPLESSSSSSHSYSSTLDTAHLLQDDSATNVVGDGIFPQQADSTTTTTTTRTSSTTTEDGTENDRETHQHDQAGKAQDSNEDDNFVSPIHLNPPVVGAVASEDDNIGTIESTDNIPSNVAAHSIADRFVYLSPSRPASSLFPSPPLTAGGAGQNSTLFFIVHTGPPKTATTTLQVELTRFYFNLTALKDDNYYYAGKYFDPNGNRLDVVLEKGRLVNRRTPLLDDIFNVNCQKQMYMARLEHRQQQQQQQQEPDKATKRFELPDCWIDLVQHVKEQANAQNHVFMSEEALHYRIQRFGGRMVASVDWTALRETVQFLGYQLMVVAGYRRLFELLPSEKQEKEKYAPLKRKYQAWPHLQGSIGRTLQPLFPSVLTNRYVTGMTSLHGYLRIGIPDDIPVYVYSLYDYPQNEMSIRSHFLCHVLPYANHSCQISRELDQSETETRANPQVSLYYDALACEAARKGLLGGVLLLRRAWKRRAVALAIQHYQEVVLKRSSRDFPVICPNVVQLKQLLDASLQLESELIPTLYESHREHHTAAFASAVAKKTFCWVDLDAVLSMQEWKAFFAHTFHRNHAPNITMPTHPLGVHGT